MNSLDNMVKSLIRTSIVININELSHKFGLSVAEIRDRIRAILEETPNHSFVFVPKTNTYLELNRFKALVAQKGIIKLSDLAQELNTDFASIRNFLNSLVVVGYPGIYIGVDKFVTLQYLTEELKRISKERGKLTVSEISRIFKIDEKVAYNLLEELKREGILRDE